MGVVPTAAKSRQLPPAVLLIFNSHKNLLLQFFIAISSTPRLTRTNGDVLYVLLREQQRSTRGFLLENVFRNCDVLSTRFPLAWTHNSIRWAIEFSTFASYSDQQLVENAGSWPGVSWQTLPPTQHTLLAILDRDPQPVKAQL